MKIIIIIILPNVLVAEFCNGEYLKDYLVIAALPKINEIGGNEPCGKEACLLCNSVRTTSNFTMKACKETFKIQSSPFNCNSERVLYFLKYKVLAEAPYTENAQTKFRYRFNSYKSKGRSSKKEDQKISLKLFHNHYCLDAHLGIDDWRYRLFEQCEIHKPTKEKRLVNISSSSPYFILMTGNFNANSSNW